MQLDPNTKHDVLIIGSGASGGMTAYTLTKLGVKCVMLDAGPAFDLDKQRVLRPVYDLPYRGFGKPGQFSHVTQANEFNANVWADEKLNPYTFDSADPYYWVRIRLMGGKTLMWGRASWRLSDYEFKCKDHDGFGENWPVEYKDLAPYYDRIEPLMRVSGRREGLPQLPDGVFLVDNSQDSAPVRRFIETAKKLKVPTTKSRVSTGRLASSLNRLLPPAMETGNLTVVPNAIVREITTDRNTGLANGVRFVDRISKRDYEIRARVVVLGASTLESTRILLNSGIANSSGVLGHYLFDQFYVKNTVQAIVKDARGGGGGYVPRFRNLQTREKKFLRGYAWDFGGGGSAAPAYLPGYGLELKQKMKSLEGSVFRLTTMGEVLPRHENFVRINKEVRDAWGIPVLHIHAKFTDNEFEMAKDAMNTAEELCRGAGFEILTKHWEMVPPGESIHELGCCRMGSDPKTSVLNRFNQTHDIKNVFVVDGSSFVSGGSQNPTLTILALAMRASEYMAAEMQKGSL